MRRSKVSFSTIFSSIIKSIQPAMSISHCFFKYCIHGYRAVLASCSVFFKFQVYCHNCMCVQRLFNRPSVVVRRYYCLYVTVSRQIQLTLRSTLSIFRSFFFFKGCVTFPSCWAGRITEIEEKPGKIKQKEKYVGQTIFNLGKMSIIFQV